MNSVIEAVNLVKKFGDVAAVKGISFRVREGECYGLLGPNGAGKTTTFRMIYGSSFITEGELYVLGLNAKEHIKKIKSDIGVVPQENGLDPDFSAIDNLLIYANYLAMSEEQAQTRAYDLLAMMQLEDHAEKQIEHLSGGMKRRLVLARALLAKPKLLFLDEPTTGLDPQARNWLWEELSNLKKSGTTLFLTTHYMEEAEYLCDRLSIMNAGTIVAEGRPDELIAQHVGKEVIEIDMDARGLENFVAGIKNKYVYQIMRNKLKIFVKPNQNVREILSEVEGKTIVIRKASLNDVFLKISGNELHE